MVPQRQPQPEDSHEPIIINHNKDQKIYVVKYILITAMVNISSYTTMKSLINLVSYIMKVRINVTILEGIKHGSLQNWWTSQMVQLIMCICLDHYNNQIGQK